MNLEIIKQMFKHIIQAGYYHNYAIVNSVVLVLKLILHTALGQCRYYLLL
jgi:hypothetical protein